MEQNCAKNEQANFQDGAGEGERLLCVERQAIPFRCGACLYPPKTKAIGKAVAKHIRTTRTQEGERVEVNPDAYIRFLLEEPNPLMSGQMLQEKVANQLALNHNAFILIVRDEFEKPVELYPIPCSSVEAVLQRK